MLSGPALVAAVAASHPLAVPYRALVYRAIHLRWFPTLATARPLDTGRGHVSRFVPPGGPAALYAALDPDTAYREANQDFFRLLNAPGGGGQALADAGGLRPAPVVLPGVHVSVSRLLDLGNVSVRQHLGVAADAELLVPWKLVPNPTPTQELRSTVFGDGIFEGLLDPSAQHRGHRCLVIYPDRLLAASRIHFQGFAFTAPPVSLADAVLP